MPPISVPPQVQACIDRMTHLQKEMKQTKQMYDGVPFGTPKKFQEARLAELKEKMANLGLLLMEEQEKFDKLGMNVKDIIVQNPMDCAHTSLFFAKDIMVLNCRQCMWGTPVDKEEAEVLLSGKQPSEQWLKAIKARFKEMPKAAPQPTRKSAFII